MVAAFRLYIVLICLSPLSLINDNLIVHGILSAAVAILIFVIALSAPPGESAFLSALLRPVAIVVAIPALWMLLQSLSSPFPSLNHPIWASAQAALGRPMLGSVSISPGATLVALARYMTAFGLFFVASAVSVDRQRAETLLMWLAGVATVLAAGLIGHDLGGFLALGEIGGSGPRSAIAATATLGTVLTAACGIFAIERYETRHNRGDFGHHAFTAALVTAIGASLVCWIAVIFFAPRPAVFAAACGVGALALIVVIRRLGLAPAMGAFLAVAAVGVLLSLISRDLVATGPDLTLRFSVAAKPFVDQAQRIVSDTSWLGSGAGSFAALLPIYQEPNAAQAGAVAPTTMADILIGLGAPALWLVVIGAVAGIGWLLRGVLQRGRDSFFPAAGACCGIVLLMQAFADASLYSTVVMVIATAALGLGSAQRVSRSSR